MTDEDLLKKAAKAACAMPYLDLSGEPTGIYQHPLEPGLLRESSGGWNPLIDDGDALRLAVQLSMEFWIEGRTVNMKYIPERAVCNEYSELVGTDPYAATRRVIVRAAADETFKQHVRTAQEERFKVLQAMSNEDRAKHRVELAKRVSEQILKSDRAKLLDD